MSIYQEDQAGELRQRWSDQRLVLTNGCFDLLHLGHVRYLAAARALGDRLVVGLNSDESVRLLKGPNRPITPQLDRAEILSGLRSVDDVVIFIGERATTLIRALKPDVYVKGGDYTLETLDLGEVAALREVGAAIELVPIVSGRSTTRILQALGKK
jgi:rfaE bifunctional protein nucleotidyltransferase chain/domain